MQIYIDEFLWAPLVVLFIYLVRYIWGARKNKLFVVYDYKDGIREYCPARRTKLGVVWDSSKGTYETETKTLAKISREGRFLPKTNVEWHVNEGQETFTTNLLQQDKWTAATMQERRKAASHWKYGKFLDAGMAQLKRAPLWILILAGFTGMWIQSMITIIIQILTEGG